MYLYFFNDKRNPKKKPILFPTELYKEILAFFGIATDTKTLLSLDRVCRYTKEENQQVWKKWYPNRNLSPLVLERIKKAILIGLKPLQTRIEKDYLSIQKEYESYNDRYAWMNNPQNMHGVLIMYSHGFFPPPFEKQDYYHRTNQKKHAIDTFMKRIAETSNMESLLALLVQMKEDKAINLHRIENWHNIFYSPDSAKTSALIQERVETIYGDLQKSKFGSK